MDDVQLPQPSAESLAAALGTPLFRTDLYIPEYPADGIGPWRVNSCALHVCHGYWGRPYVVADMPALLRDSDGGSQTWMSMSPYELESQELGCRHAYGHTVVMGLGMAWIAINAALNPAVERVTVIERDADVIALVRQSGVLERAPEEAGRRITIVQADALEWRPTEPVDFLYADIWLRLAEPQTLAQVRQMQANVGAERVYFWGQELAIRDHAAAIAPGAELDQALLERVIAERIKLPLLVPPGADYSALIRSVYRPV